MRNITRTFLRTDEMMTRYMADMRELEEKGMRTNPFINVDPSEIVADFTHWFIIKNKYPYDAIATTSHILVLKREVPFKWELLNQAELDEFVGLRKGYLAEHYDLIWENLPKGQTVPGHFHLNILVLKREQI